MAGNAHYLVIDQIKKDIGKPFAKVKSVQSDYKSKKVIKSRENEKDRSRNDVEHGYSWMSLERGAGTLSDHIVIMIGEPREDWGPCPFWFYNGWLDDREMMTEAIKAFKHCKTNGSKGFVLLSKLKAIKRNIKRCLARKRNDMPSLISSTVNQYVCNIDLFECSGYLDNALTLIKEMPFDYKKLFESEPHNSGYYVVLSNLYAEMGRWNDAEKVRGLKKDLGCSSVESIRQDHVFELLAE
ncbi:hypothetical protein Ddye_027327 [Dipteronia dyeriana]|uniref:Pentatricopeptide repeat-containing protein n=1 Tax=Dipteronia dyeriana TaxID=168575 RepID=A0AAD9TNX2_9ROSI|nr:hypothetical protein Ddye_027327 [Dipteronia dyeriana]